MQGLGFWVLGLGFRDAPWSSMPVAQDVEVDLGFLMTSGIRGGPRRCARGPRWGLGVVSVSLSFFICWTIGGCPLQGRSSI